MSGIATFLFPCIFLLIFTAEKILAQIPPVPDGRRLREIVEDKYPEGNLLIGGTTGQWAFGTPTGIIMDREYSYVTPENDFKQSYVHPDNNTWRWDRPDAWINHITDNKQVLRIHGPVSPQASNWAKNDNRTVEELETNMRAYVGELCKRYNGKTNFMYMDVVNEVIHNGQWKKNEEGTGWEMPWFIIGQDNDKNKTPLFIKYAFQIAAEYAPDMSLVINQHERTVNENSWDLLKETIQYLRDSNLRVDGVGWQAHVDVGWEKIEGQQETLRNIIDWAHANELDFHITECNVFLDNNGTEAFRAQAETFKAIMDIVVEKSANGVVTWNTWNIDDKNAWRDDRYPTLFDDNYRAKPAYYAIQLALETKGDYTSKHNIILNVKNTQSGEALSLCQVTFNNETKLTDQNGDAEFEITAGFYNARAEKTHFESAGFSNLSVYSDTVFAFSLDSAEILYDVTFQIEDKSSGDKLSAVKIELGDQEKSTGFEGASVFTVNPGVYTVNFEKLNFTGIQSEFTIQSDTAFTILLERSHADAKFRLKDGTTPVNNAMVVFADDTLYTSSIGFCIFRSLPVDSAYSYSVEHKHYKSFSDNVLIINDTTINLQLEKTVANMEFVITTEGTAIQNPFVVMNNDTVWFEENLRAMLYHMPIDSQYIFQIFSTNFNTYSDTLWLANDTIINVLMAFSSVRNEPTGEFKIYPNPAQNQLYIDWSGKVSEFEIIDYSGKIIKYLQINSAQTVMDISDLSEGYYFLKGKEKNSRSQTIRKFIIQR